MDTVPFSELSNRQKRRLNKIDDVSMYCINAPSCIAGSLSTCGPSGIISSSGIAGKSDYSMESFSSSSESEETLETDQSMQSFSGCILNNTVNTDETSLMSTEDHLETVIVNWMDECPQMPVSYVSKLLKHLHTFYPCIALTFQTLKK